MNLQPLYLSNVDDEMIVTELAEPMRRDGGRYPERQLPPRAPRPLIGRGGLGGIPWPMGLGLGKRRDESYMPNILCMTNMRF